MPRSCADRLPPAVIDGGVVSCGRDPMRDREHRVDGNFASKRLSSTMNAGTPSALGMPAIYLAGANRYGIHNTLMALLTL
jgi:hypothetical protein